MRKLALGLILLSGSLYAQEITENEITKQHLSVIKDTEVELMLDKTPEFADCRSKYEFVANDGSTQKEDKLKKATECFEKKLKDKDADTLKKMAENLNLEGYGLIKSKTSQDITNYLSKKMTKSLTGKDPDEKDPRKILESLKWENQKIVDQKVFIDLYKNQLVKSSLFEVSRYCYEDLEIVGESKTNKSVQEYWDSKISMDKSVPKNKKTSLTAGLVVSDTGSSRFMDLSNIKDVNDKKIVYQEIIKGISKSDKNIDPIFHEKFLHFCQSSIKSLCDDFKKTNNLGSTSIAKNNVTQMTKGANSCLLMSRLESIKTALKNSELVGKQFEEMASDKNDFALKMLTDPEIYQGGKGKNEESLDDISNMTSADMLASQNQDNFEELEKKCSLPGANDPACDEFLVKSDGLDKAIHSVEYKMNLKRELEVARVKDLAKKPVKELEDYLKENNLYDLLEKVQKNTISNSELESEIRKIYDARKVAEIEALKLKVGKRQVSEDEYNKLGTNKDVKINQNIKDAKEERARLAQVMLFNNIITGQLELQEVGGKSLGRNVGAWTKEAKDLQSSDGIDMTLFEGIQKDADQYGSKSEDTSIAGSGIIDLILGKKD